MKLPHTVCPHTFAVYCQSNQAANDVISSASITWDIKSPPSLEKLVISALASNIEAWCPWLLQALGHDHVSLVLEQLSLQLPLTFCIKHVPDGFYWQRRALDMWPGPELGVCDVARHSGSWRRLVLERHVQGLIEGASPRLELQNSLRMQLREAAPHVRILDLRELQFGSVTNKSGEQEFRHLPLSLILVHFTALQELRLRVGPRECGLKFAWSKFSLSEEDAISLNQGLAACPSLTSLSVCCSHVRGQTLQMLLIPQPPAVEQRKQSAEEQELGEEDEDTGADLHEVAPPVAPPPILLALTQLDISHNDLQDDATEVLANFLISHCALRRLKLVNNKIGATGATTLAQSLSLSSLRDLDLSLNQITDVGGSSLASHGTKLHSLRLAGCGLGQSSAKVLSRAIVSNDLVILDLSNNDLSQVAGQDFYQVLSTNIKTNLRDLDLRMTNIQPELRQLIMDCLRNREI